jgi:hypothetical protein
VPLVLAPVLTGVLIKANATAWVQAARILEERVEMDRPMLDGCLLDPVLGMRLVAKEEANGRGYGLVTPPAQQLSLDPRRSFDRRIPGTRDALGAGEDVLGGHERDNNL